MTQLDARITELVARLTALERERAEILAEINTLRSVRSEEAAAIRAIRMMAERGRNTLILVHRRQLMDQWIERLTTFGYKVLGTSDLFSGQVVASNEPAEATQ